MYHSTNKLQTLFFFYLLCLQIMDGLRALDLHQLLQDRFVILTGGRDRRGGPVLCFPSTPRRERIKSDDIRRILTYLFGISRYIQSY